MNQYCVLSGGRYPFCRFNDGQSQIMGSDQFQRCHCSCWYFELLQLVRKKLYQFWSGQMVSQISIWDKCNSRELPNQKHYFVKHSEFGKPHTDHWHALKLSWPHSNKGWGKSGWNKTKINLFYCMIFKRCGRFTTQSLHCHTSAKDYFMIRNSSILYQLVSRRMNLESSFKITAIELKYYAT